MAINEIIKLASAILTGIAIPIIGVLIGRSDRKSESREAAQEKFNSILLEGVQRIGDLSNANAKATLQNGSLESKGELQKAQDEYAQFRSKVDDFTRKQTIGTL